MSWEPRLFHGIDAVSDDGHGPVGQPPPRLDVGVDVVAQFFDLRRHLDFMEPLLGQVTADRVVDNRYIEYAVGKLGPFVLENKDSKLEGCR